MINLKPNLKKAERIAYIDQKLESLYPEPPVPLDTKTHTPCWSLYYSVRSAPTSVSTR